MRKLLSLELGIALLIVCRGTLGEPASAPAKVEAQPLNGAAVTALPKPDEILARFVKELGGKAAFDKLDSQHVLGKFEMSAQGITGKLEVFAKRQDKLLIKINLPALGEMLQGYDGKIGWMVAPMTGPMVLDGKMLEQSREQARFDAVLHAPSEFTSMQTVGRTNFDAKECYQVKLVRQSGQEVNEFYDVKTGLLAGSTELQETPLGNISVTAMTSDYKKFGDLLFATRMTQKMGPMAQVMIFEQMDFNSVADPVFDLPSQVKALTKK